MSKTNLLSLCIILLLGIFLVSCEDVNEFIIEFETNGGSIVETQIVEKNSVITTQTVTREGYTFDGWYSDQALTLLFDFNTIPTKNIKLYAKWNVNRYSISFDSNGGSHVNSITRDFASSVTLPTSVTKEGYTFDGWYSDELLTIEQDFNTMPSQNIRLYAKWYREDGLIYINHLTISFSPGRDSQSMIQGISYLPLLFKAEMAKQGYYVETVHVNVETSYEAVGEGLDAGTIDVGFLGSTTYAAYSNASRIEAILTAERYGLTKNSTNPKDWNDGQPTETDLSYKIPYYRAIGIAGTSAKGRELADKINNDEEITWEDLQTVKIGVQSPTSSAGRVYPSLLFSELYDGKTLADLPGSNILSLMGYGSAMAALASGDVDIAFVYADARRDYANNWTLSTNDGGYGRIDSIWEETDVVFVTAGIYNDAIAISKATVDDELKLAIQQAFINLSKDLTLLDNPSGEFVYVNDIFRVVNSIGYMITNDSDYENARKALEILNR